MKLNARTAAAIFSLLTSTALVTPHNYAQEPPIQTLPEVSVTSDPEVRHHPGDSTFAEDRLPGCVEVITPRTGGEMSGSHQARYGRPSISVMPDMNNPRGVRDTGRDGVKEEQALPPGYVSPVPQCQFGGRPPK